MTDIAATETNYRADAGHGISFGEAFRVWLRVALLSFGGPAGQIAVMHRILVEEKNWISESRFLHALNYCMLLPGPEAQQLATYIGWLLHRTAGGIMAGGLFILPGVIAIMGLSYIYAAFGNVGFVEALFFGLKAAVLAIVIQAVVRVGKRALRNRIMIALAAIAFIAIFFFNVPFPIIIIAAGVIGYLGAKAARPEFAAVEHGGGKSNAAVDSMLGEELPDHVRPTVPARVESQRGLAAAVAGAGLRAPDRVRPGQCVQPDRAVLQQDGDGDVRRRLCGAGLCRAAGGRALSLGAAARNARWPRHGRDHARPADHGAAVRRLHGRLSRSRRAVADAGGHARRIAGDLGDVHARASSGSSSARRSSKPCAATRDWRARCRRSPPPWSA